MPFRARSIQSGAYLLAYQANLTGNHGVHLPLVESVNGDDDDDSLLDNSESELAQF